VIEMVGVKGTSAPKREKELRQSKAWALKGFGGKTVRERMDMVMGSVVLALVAVSWRQDHRQEAVGGRRAQQEALQAYLDRMS
jgi:hypothetical protein